MSNMSYCRFNNTSIDLEECLDTINDREIASKEELAKAKKMFHMFLNFCESEGIIDNYNESAVDDLLEESCENEDDDDE